MIKAAGERPLMRGRTARLAEEHALADGQDMWGLGMALARCYHARNQRVDTQLAELGLTEAQFRILCVLESAPRHSAGLARKTGVSPQAVFGSIRVLERREYIRRREVGGSRLVESAITVAGRDALAEAREHLTEIYQDVRRSLTDDEYQQLVHLLGLLHRCLDPSTLRTGTPTATGR